MRRARVREQLAVGGTVAVLATIAETVVAIVRSIDDLPTIGDGIYAALHVLAMYMPLGLALGLGTGIALASLDAAPFFEPIRVRFASFRRAFRRDPIAFRVALGTLAGALVLATALPPLARHFATAYQDRDLAAWAMTGAVGACLAGAVVVAAIVARAARPAAAALGRFASVGVVSLVALAGAVGGVLAAHDAIPQLFEAYEPVVLGWAPGIALAWLATTAVVRWRSRRRPPGRRPYAVAMLVVVAAVGLLASGATYGRKNRVRAIVEQRAVVGLSLVRFWAGITDRDADGHSFAFGGDDCDDSRADVHPGARDLEGDGVDADCFDGDGSRDVASLGDGGFGAVPEGLRRPNLVLVTVDALRADHLHCYGYDRHTSPSIDALAASGTRFEHAVTQSTRSIKSVSSLFTGLHPSQIDFGPELMFPSLLAENVTIAEMLKNAGYETIGIVGSDYFSRARNLLQGFDVVHQDAEWKPPRGRAVDIALPHLTRVAAGDAPFFLWVHLINVHARYLHDGRASRFGDELVDLYDEEIVLADEQIGRLVRALDELGVADETVVVVASDHGEAFNEHGTYWHSFSLYEEEARVPLVVRAPGTLPRVVPERVALIDLVPTLANFAGVRLPERTPARSLLPMITGHAHGDPDRYLFAEIVPDGGNPADIKAVWHGDEKLLWWVRDGRIELYDLARDPGERNDLSDDRRDDADELLGVLRAWVASTAVPGSRNDDFVAAHRLAAPPTRMTRRLDLRFPGELTVLGYDLPRREVFPGDEIPLTFYYRVDGDIDRDLFFYVDLVGPPGFPELPHFHGHHFPLDARYHTNDWQPGELLRDPVRIVVPLEVPTPTTMTLSFTILDESRRRLAFEGPNGAADTIELDRIEIRPGRPRPRPGPIPVPRVAPMKTLP